MQQTGVPSQRGVARAILARCETVAPVLGSLAHPVRLKILCRLMERECSVNELTAFCGISQSAMSQFLKRMKAQGLVAARRENQFVFYRIADARLQRLLGALSTIYC
ncbi:MAG TPA: metalloregulator ArsR/SmtB family transcription factor [bacterium]|nr:metalloregulator ArsR/SmtB family transcription factor [bacterium]